ncbi:MAG: helix-turn-helix domain-containing protein [bacterium]
MIKRKKPELNFSEVELIKKIINTRKAFGLSQADLAKRAGVSKGYISQFEVFYYKPTDQIIKKISKGLNYQAIVDDFIKIKENLINNIDDDFITTVPLVKKLVSDIKNIKQIGLFPIPIYLSQFLNKMSDIYAFKVDNNLLSPEINKNDLIIVKYLDKLPKLNQNNDIFLIIDNKIEIMIAKVNRLTFLFEFLSDDDEIIQIEKNSLIERELSIIDLKKQDWRIKGIVIAVISQKLMPVALELF